MKKLNILLSLGLLFSLFACERDDIPTFTELGGERHVYSQKVKDSTEVTFAFYPGQTEIKVAFPVQISGASDKDEYFKLAVVAPSETTKGTTADASLYEVPERCVARVGHRYDTAWITIKKAEILNTQKFRLQVRLVEGEKIKPGRSDCRDFVIWFHNMMAKPSWWSSAVTSYYFGTYTEEKLTAIYDFFGRDLKGSTDSQFRQYALEFKQHLKEKKAAGTPILEKNGSEMTVPVLGNLI